MQKARRTREIPCCHTAWGKLIGINRFDRFDQLDDTSKQ
jgi:hypothetical protein